MTLNSSIRVRVDLTNPGQFFGCCGMLELADRLWPGALGWFEGNQFLISANGTLGDLLQAISDAEFVQSDLADATASPIVVSRPFRALRLDWWSNSQSGGSRLKGWAGRMDVVRIGNAMRKTMGATRFASSDIFDIGIVVYDPLDPTKKVEPFYFDARRASGSHSRDVGFSPDVLGIETAAYPAVEFLTLVGLQRTLPATTDRIRFYDYSTWGIPLSPELLPMAVGGASIFPTSHSFRFETWFRTGQRKHKAFRPAQPLTQGVLS